MSVVAETDIAAGVKQVTVGERAGSHVYLLEHPDGPIAFDAGVRGEGAGILRCAGGRLSRVILSHAHFDHRGGANELDAPIYCHPDEVADAEGDAGRHYTDFTKIANPRVREAMPLLAQAWDDGPVRITGTVEEGEDVAGFRVLHLPGHAPGLIALFRPSDRLLLAADALYTFDMETAQPSSPRVPHPATNADTEAARASIRRLIDLDAASVWAGHAMHFDRHVAKTLEVAAAHPYP